MFEILPAELKSLAVRARAKYAPFEWMSGAHALSTGLGLESEGMEKPLNELAEWTADKVKVYSFVSGAWFNARGRRTLKI
ncbi:hypothetical protein C8J56DRAFT_85444 [Mycena floridula]|nr:hypothetical protein C8J56DRAFT_85444 [Mycena floridula]